MPAGAGPLPVVVNAAAVGTSETVVATFPASNWDNPSGLGNLIEFAGFFSAPSTGGSLVLKVRQGTTVAGTQVGPTITQVFVASAGAPVSIAAVDTSAFASLQPGGQYVVTATYAAAAGGSLTGVATLETCAPIA